MGRLLLHSFINHTGSHNVQQYEGFLQHQLKPKSPVRVSTRPSTFKTKYSNHAQQLPHTARHAQSRSALRLRSHTELIKDRWQGSVKPQAHIWPRKLPYWALSSICTLYKTIDEDSAKPCRCNNSLEKVGDYQKVSSAWQLSNEKH
jgi:hypothetical protein